MTLCHVHAQPLGSESEQISFVELLVCSTCICTILYGEEMYEIFLKMSPRPLWEYLQRALSSD